MKVTGLTVGGFRLTRRHAVLAVLLVTVTAVQVVQPLAAAYATDVYPVIGTVLSHVSGLLPFSVGDTFVCLSILWLVASPIYSLLVRHKRAIPTLLYMVEFLLWLHVWFYGAWGLNYSQPSLYSRTRMKPAEFRADEFRDFAYAYADSLNANYIHMDRADKDYICRHTTEAYTQMADGGMGINRPFNGNPRVKTMLYTPLASAVGVTGSMMPFFCEFTINGDVLPTDYAATYAHEYSHMLGITSEGEANFYAYLACTGAGDMAVRFSGYYSILHHMLDNVNRLLGEEEYAKYTAHLRPEIIRLARQEREYWTAKYSPTIGSIQDAIYDVYLKLNKIESGRQSYSEVIGLLMSYHNERNKDA